MPLGVIMSKKNNKKNSTRKNYKIEALEPRLMMDADSNFDPETSSLATVYTNLESAVEAEVLNKTDDVNSAAVFLKDSSGIDISEVSQILSKVKSEVRSNVENAFESAKTDAKNYIDKLEVGELGFGIEYLNNFTCYCLSIKAEASA